MRRTDVQRDSRPASHRLFADADEKARLEARNGLLQFDEVVRLIDKSASAFRLRPSMVQGFQRIAILDIYTCAGNYRTGPVFIEGATHQPPAPAGVAGLVEEMCDYINGKWLQSSPIHLAAYAMWRVNWIHPFAGGNGRTSRAVSNLVLCARLGYRLPGTLTVPEQIVANRQPYYAALDAADAAWAQGVWLTSARWKSFCRACWLSSSYLSTSKPEARSTDFFHLHRNSRRPVRPNPAGDLGAPCVLCHFEIVVRLKVDPKLGRRSEVASQAQGGVRGDGAPATDDVVDPRCRHEKFGRQAIGGQS